MMTVPSSVEALVGTLGFLMFHREGYVFTGQFKPGPEANAAIGSVGQVEYVDEDRVELVVNDNGRKKEVKNVIEELKKVNV
jgi:hypothetical protein